MKLLFDENLSSKLIQLVAPEFPESSHVELVSQRGCTDAWLWDYARANDLVIVSKDNDFRQRAVIAGPPPKVVWLSVGNAGTDTIASLLRARAAEIVQFDADKKTSLLVLDLFAASA